MSKSIKKIIINFIFLFCCITLTIYFVFKDKDIFEVFSFILNVSPTFTIVGILLVLIFISIESVIFRYIFKSLGQKISMFNCLLYSFVGFFFSLVTPAALGGQPAQFFFMKKDKIPAHLASITLIIVAATYKLVLVILGLIILIFQPTAIMVYLEPVMFWMYLGIILNTLCVIMFVSLIFFPEFTRKIVLSILKFLYKIFKSQKIKKLQKRADRSMDKYKETAKYIIEHKKVTINVLLMTFLQRTILFLVTYITVLGFELDISMPIVVVLQGMIAMATEMLPLPGGLGVNEYIFEIVFLPLTGPDLVTPVMVISRGLSYYAQLFMCAFMTIVAYININKKEN